MIKLPKITYNFLTHVSEISKEVDPTILLYGSTSYGIESSDFDYCFIAKKYNENDISRLEELTLDFHNRQNLRIDKDIPYRNKIIYSYMDIENMLSDKIFRSKDDRIVINPIVKTKEFLSSEEMRKRLLLNILTTNPLVIRGDSDLIEIYEEKSFELLVYIILKFNELSEFDVPIILELLYKDKYSGNSGEMWLGYKNNIPMKMKNLELSIEKTFFRLLEIGKVKKYKDKNLYYWSD